MDKEEIEAIEATVRHWEEKILRPLMNGWAAYCDGPYILWRDDGTDVPCLAVDCPLCAKYLNIDENCKDCPYKKRYGRCCDEISEPLHRWYVHPFLENAQAVTEKLKGLLPGYEYLQAQGLTRRFKRGIVLDFTVPVRCDCGCGKSNLVVIDHRTPGYPQTASREWRYEVTCDACLWSDANGYYTESEIIAEYPARN